MRRQECPNALAGNCRSVPGNRTYVPNVFFLPVSLDCTTGLDYSGLSGQGVRAFHLFVTFECSRS